MEHISKSRRLLSDAHKRSVDNVGWWAPPSLVSSNERSASGPQTSLRAPIISQGPLAGIQGPSPESSQRASTLQLHITRAGTTTSKAHSVNAPCTTYRSKAKNLPTYRSYTTVRRNILSENNEVLRRMPYFNDQDPEGVEEVRQAYIDEIDALPVRYLQAEKASRLLPLAHQMLEEFGCSEETVLSYLRSLLQDTEDASPAAPAPPPSLHNRAQTRISHQPTAGSSDAVVAQLCEATSGVTGLSLEEILQSKHDPARSAGANLGALQGGAGKPSESELSPLLCLICFMYDCTEHGEFDDQNDRKHVNWLAKEPAPVGELSRPIPLSESEEEVFITDEVRACSKTCFLNHLGHETMSNGGQDGIRNAERSEWLGSDVELLQSTLAAWRGCKTTSCALSHVLEKTCREVQSLATVDPDVGA
ncbi:MAG: hypothetical protein M1823_000159 [Watsoniomyces obsoletus]|nr:MAG: hypothetical protein M1823_000159 [Watsoniomyces obsoletus]